MMWVNLNIGKPLPFSTILSLCCIKVHNTCKITRDPRQWLDLFVWAFSYRKKRGGRGRQLMFETQPVSLLAHNSSTVYVHPITLSHLPDWWCKQLEGMEHIRTEHGEGLPYFYFARLGPKWKKKGGIKKVWSLFWKRNKGASFGMVQAVLVASWLSVSHSLS